MADIDAFRGIHDGFVREALRLNLTTPSILILYQHNIIYSYSKISTK